jgi:predicted RNA-binding protein with PUA domain
VAPTAAPSTPVESDDGSGDGGVREKVASVWSAATSFANKVRQEAPKKVQELKEQRASGRHILLAERDGRTVAVGPYRDAETAQRSASKVTGANQIIELMSEAAFFMPEGGESSAGS